MMTIMTDIIAKITNKHPKPRYVYAVTGGKYLGELLVLAKKDGDDLCFLTLPDMQNRVIPKDKFNFALKEHIVEIVQKIPNDVYTVCLKQHAKSIANPSA